MTLPRFSAKKLSDFLLMFWGITLLASATWLFLYGVSTLNEPFTLYIFLLFFMTLLKLLMLSQSNRLIIWLLLIVEILSLNLLSVIPLFFLRNHVANDENALSLRGKAVMSLLSLAVVLQTMIFLQLFK